MKQKNRKIGNYLNKVNNRDIKKEFNKLSFQGKTDLINYYIIDDIFHNDEKFDEIYKNCTVDEDLKYVSSRLLRNSTDEIINSRFNKIKKWYCRSYILSIIHHRYAGIDDYIFDILGHKREII